MHRLPCRLTTSVIPAFSIGMSLLLLGRANMPAQSYTVLHSFAGGEGTYPNRLVLSGTTLYGAAYGGGISNNGTVYQLKTDGSGYTVLKNLTSGADGAGPCGALLLSGTTFYGALILPHKRADMPLLAELIPFMAGRAINMLVLTDFGIGRGRLDLAQGAGVWEWG